MIFSISPSEAQARLSKVQLLALDVDGTLTDGGLYYSDSGEEFKKFNVKDGMGMRLLIESGIEIAIVSANSSASVLHRAKKLRITHVYLGIEDKLEVLRSLCDQLGISMEHVAYVGDDINDLLTLQAVGCPLTVADAIEAVKQVAIGVTQQMGGQGAVREICDLIISSRTK